MKTSFTSSSKKAPQSRGMSAMLRRLAARRGAQAFAAGTMFLTAGLPAYAASSSFVANPTSANFSDVGNWAGGIVPGTTTVATNNDVATFGVVVTTNGTGTSPIGSATNPIIIDTVRSIGGINFTAGAGAFVIGTNAGTALNLGNTAAGLNAVQISATTEANPEVIAAPLSFSAPSSTNGAYQFINNATSTSATLSFTGNITANSSGSRPTILTLTGTNTGNNIISGNFSQNTVAQGVNSLIKTGTGTWILSGVTTLNGTASTGVSITGGILQFNGALTGTASATAIANAATLNFGNTAAQTYAGVISGAGTTNIIGTAAETFTGVNTYTGATTINTGATLALTTGTISGTSGVTDNGTLAYNPTGNQIIGYAIGGTGALTKSGAGTVSLTNANDNYVGATTVNTGGALTIDHSGTNTGALGNTAITVNAGGTLLVKGAASLGTGTGASVTLVGGTSAATDGTFSMQDGLISTANLNGNLTLGSGGAGGSLLGFDIGTSSGSSDQLAVAGTVTPTAGTTSTINLAAAGGFNPGTYTLITAAGGGLGTSGFALATTGTNFSAFNLTNSTANSEVLTITGNPVPVTAYWTGVASATALDAANNFGDGSATTHSNFSTDQAGTIDPLQLPGSVTNLIFTATNAVPSAAPVLTTTLDTGYGINSLTFAVPASTGITSTVIATNGKTLTIGAGGLTLNSSTAGTNPNASSATINGTGSVVVNGSQNWADNDNALPLTISTGITAQSGTTVLTLNGTGTAGVTLGGVIGNGSVAGTTLGLVLNQAGTTQLNGANTFTGGTTINSGVVQLGAATGLGAGAVSFGAGSTGDLRINGLGVTLAGINTNATLGTPIVENANATAATLTDNVPTATTATYGGVIQDGAGGGALTLTKTGAGVQVLSGQNTFTGGVNINAGALNVGAASNPGVSGPLGTGLINFGGGAIQYSAANQFDYSSRFNLASATAQPINIDTNGQNVTFATPLAPTTLTASLFKQGLGTLTVGGNSTYTGTTTVAGGTLTLTGSSNTGTINISPTGGGTAIINLSTPVSFGAVAGITSGTAGSNGTSIVNIGPGAAITGTNTAAIGNFQTGLAATGLGVINVTGGTVNPGSYLEAGGISGGIGIINLSGGTYTSASGLAGTVGTIAGANGVLNVSGTGSYNSTGANVASGVYIGEAGAGILNVSGGGLLTLGGGIAASQGLDIGKTSVATASGIVNLGAVSGGGSGASGGGTITTSVVQKVGALASGTFNFHGGTLGPTSTFINAAFFNGLTNAYVYGEGGTINNNGQAITIGQALLAPTGSGVSSIAGGGTGYTPGGTPEITLTGGGGTGATAVGNVDALGNLTVTVTNPGINYTSAPTVNVVGGGGTPGTPTATTTTDTSGALTFTGTGTTTLSNGGSTYGGANVSSGNLVLTNATGSATGTGTVNDSGGNTAVLSGTGISTGPLIVTGGSRLAPGVNTAADPSGIAGTVGVAGKLSVGTTGGATLTNAALDYDLSTTGDTGTPGAANDSITTGGTLTLGTMAFNFNELGGTLDQTPGDVYTLITGASTVTGFNTANISTTFSGTGATTYIPVYNATATGLNVSFAPAPEPAQTATMGLIALGMGALFLRARKRRKSEKTAS